MLMLCKKKKITITETRTNGNVKKIVSNSSQWPDIREIST